MVSDNQMTPEAVDAAMRQLALVDRVIGLEAELAQVRMNHGGLEVAALKRSLTWRVGSAILAPARALRHVVGRR